VKFDLPLFRAPTRKAIIVYTRAESAGTGS